MSGHAPRVARDHCLAPERVDAAICGGRYRSLFEDLPPLSVDEQALHGLGYPGGPCDLDAVGGRWKRFERRSTDQARVLREPLRTA